uniref:Uncharacterized protein n=1 Tax=Tanacetum cinerariifolium TaxID=118510 RepID=A0A6L2M299_TANCI|nr:hypothetical protein [Tanacetum cinerariifolium]
MLSIHIHHGGSFRRFPKEENTLEVKKPREKVGGKEAIFDMVDMNELSMHELNKMVIQLGYTGEIEAMFYHNLRPEYEASDSITLKSVPQGMFINHCRETIVIIPQLSGVEAGDKQGLSPDVSAIVNHHKVSKEIWDRVKLLMQGTKLSLQERECKLYDEFNKFSFVRDSGLVVLVFTQEDDLIACFNKAMAFLSAVATLRDIDFGRNFDKQSVPQQELSAKQAFWLQTSHPNTDQYDISPVKIEAPRELPKVSLVNTSLKKLKYHLGKFDTVVTKWITPDAITEGEWGFEHTKAVFLNEIISFLKTLKDIFNVFDKDLLNETRACSKEHGDSLIAQLNSKSMENADLKGQIQEKVFVTTTLQNEIRRLKGKNVLDNATTITNATTIAPGLFKLDIEPISHRLKNNMDAVILITMVEVCRTNASQEHHKRGTRRVGWNELASEANGQVEVTNREIIKGMKRRLRRAHQAWIDDLPQVLWAYRTTPKSSNRETTFSLVYGSEAVIPIEICVETKRVQEFYPKENEKR